MENIMKKESRKITKRIALYATMFALSVSSLSGCKSNNNNGVEQTTLMTEEKETKENVTKVEETSESKKEEVTTRESSEVETELVTETPTRTFDDAVNDYYEDNKDFFGSHGMNANDLKKTILVLNNLLYNDGELSVSREDVWDAYGNISKILLPEEVSQKIDNINAINMGINVNDGIVLENNRPSLKSLLVVETPGTKYLIEKIEEYDKFMNDLYEDLNNGTYDKKAVEDYIIKLNVDDVNSGKTYFDKVNENGEKYVLAAINYNVLQIGSITHPQEEYITVNKDGVDRLKINATNGEIDVQNAIIHLQMSGEINQTIINDVVSYYPYLVTLSNEEAAKVVEERYGVNLDQANLLISYVTFRTKMPDTKYNDIMCNAMARDVLMVEESYTYTKKLR